MKKLIILLFISLFGCNNNINISTTNNNYDLFYYSNINDKYQINKMNLATKNKNILVEDNNNNYSFSIDKNLKKMSYISSLKNSKELFVMNLVTKEKKKISEKTNISNQYISPNGEKIAYISDNEIFITDIDNGSTKQVSKDTKNINSTSWSSDSNKLVFGNNKQIYIYENDKVTKLTSSFENYNPVISPDNKKIAFVSRRNNDWNIFIIDIDGKNEIKASSGKEDIMPTWSFDSKNIVFISKKEVKDEKTFINQLNVVSSDGKDFKTLYEGNEVIDPFWSNDNKFIVYSSSENGNKDIFIINIDTLKKVNITNSIENDYSPKIFNRNYL